MTCGVRTARVASGLFCLVVLVSVSLTFASPATAQANVDPADYEYDASELLLEESITRSGELTLSPNGSAQEGDTIVVELEEGISGFEIEAATDASGEDVGISVDATADAVTIELTDLDGADSLDGAELAVVVDLTATNVAAGDAGNYDSTPIATVRTDETDGGLGGERALFVTIDGSASIEFDADSIDETAKEGYLPERDHSRFIIEFASESVRVNDGDTINFSVDPDVIGIGDDDGFRIVGAWESAIQDENISDIDVAVSNDAGVLDDHNDQITIRINTVDGESKLVSNVAASIGLELAVETESMKHAADRYRDVDFLTVDVEGEENAELTDNGDIRTESPVVLDIYPGEADTDGFEIRGVQSGEEFGISEGRTIRFEELEDRFGNEIPRAKMNVLLDGNADRYDYGDIWTETDGTGGLALEGGGTLDVPLGTFELSVEVVDVPGPATQSKTGDDVTETVSGLGVYPDDVTLTTPTDHDDFDADGGTIELEVDLGVSDESVDRVDLELRRESGSGAVAFYEGGAPTATDLWEETGYGGDDHLGTENPWAIERDLTAADFENGTRRYVLGSDAADRYEIGVSVMPYEKTLVPDSSAIETSLSSDPDEANRDRTEIVATGRLESVSNVSIETDHEFVGTELDEGADIEIRLEGFEDENGNAVTDTGGEVSVRFSGVDLGSVTPRDGETAVTLAVDPTAIDGGTIGTATDAEMTLEFANGTDRIETDLTLVHRVIERPAGAWHTASISQPASLYVDAEGDRDVVQWDPENETYDGISIDADDDSLESHHLGHEQLHRGMYVRSEDGPLRLGFDYITTADETIDTRGVDLDSGWHFGSSNYDISTHSDRFLEGDLNWVDHGFDSGDDSFAVWNHGRTDRLHDATDGIDVDGADETVTHDKTYWIKVDEDRTEPLTRDIVSPIFSDGGDEE